MSASPAEEGTEEREEALDASLLLSAEGALSLEVLSGRLHGVDMWSWGGDLLRSFGSLVEVEVVGLSMGLTSAGGDLRGVTLGGGGPMGAVVVGGNGVLAREGGRF